MQVITPDPATQPTGLLPGLPSDNGSVHPDARALEKLLAAAFDDSYVLVLSPRLPGVDPDLRGLLVGPGGVRALLVRRWHGHFRHRGRAWEFDTHGRRGWIPCRTDPTRDARRIAHQVGSWMEDALGTRLPVEATIAFPDRTSQIELTNDPVTEVVTVDNAPWWARRVSRVRRLDGRSAGRLLEAVLAAA